MSRIEKLQSRWNVTNAFQVVVILLVFACTGATVVYLMKPVLKFLFGEHVPGWAWAVYYVFILPVYNVFLLIYGFVFGKFRFFWNFEKRLFKRVAGLFGKKK